MPLTTRSPAVARSRAIGSLAGIVMLALVFRLPAVTADFWFDEILSLDVFAASARSASDIFLASAIRHDNNHHLNTVVLFLLGDRTNWLIYRVPALLCGVLATVAAYRVGQRHGRAAAWITGLLVASSTLLVVHSSEARGYGWVLAASTVAFLALDRYLRTHDRAALLSFGVSIAIGLAGHPAILHAYLGAWLWSGYRLRRHPGALLRLHALPMLWMLAWLFVVARGSRVGGGPEWTWAGLLDQALAWTLGYPVGTVPVALVGATLVLVVLWDAARLWSDGSDEGLFYVGAILVPVALLAALDPPFLFPRYLVVALLFLLVVLGRSLARLSTASMLGRALAVAIVGVFVVGHVLHLAAVVRERHGAYPAAVHLIAPTASGELVHVTSRSLDQWSRLPIDFYARRMGLAHRIRYVPRSDPRRSDVDIDWIVEPSQPCGDPPSPEIVLPGDLRFTLRRSFPVCGPSGMSWALYAPGDRIDDADQSGPTPSSAPPATTR